jgi:hypothetical protein
MNKLFLLAIFPWCLSGCASLFGPPPMPGDTAEVVQAKFGQPTGAYQDGADTLLEYARGPLGQYTYMARIGPDGRMRSFEQVLTGQKFGTIKIGRDTKESVLRIIGRPSKQVRYFSVDGDVWQYRYKENDVWNSLMDVQFDRNGVVQALVNGPDEEREPRWLR